jgi:hypothetical protein
MLLKKQNMSESAILATIESVFARNPKKSAGKHMAEDMMHVMGAYGKVALKRFCDTVPMNCSAGLLPSFTDKIDETLSVASDAEIEKLLYPAPNEQNQRKKLKLHLSASTRAWRLLPSSISYERM